MRDEMDFPSAHPGLAAPVPAPTPSSAVLDASVALDDDVRAWFGERAVGDMGLRALVNAALREHIRREGEPLERLLRRVMREELRKAG
jgi:hypothetical protein